MEILSRSIDRREALRRSAFLLGGALSAPTLAGVLAGCDRGAAGGAWKPIALSPEQGEMVAALAERILPETDTPGARAARVHEFIDVMLAEYYPAEARARFLAGLDRLERRVRTRSEKGFSELPAEEQIALVEAMNRAALRDREAKPEAMAQAREPVLRDTKVEQGRSDPEGVAAKSGAVTLDDEWDPEDVGKESFFRVMKELTLVGYYTSEVGARQELAVNPMGTYRADVPYSEIGHSWI